MEDTQDYTHEELMDYESAKADLEYDRMREERLISQYEEEQEQADKNITKICEDLK